MALVTSGDGAPVKSLYARADGRVTAKPSPLVTVESSDRGKDSNPRLLHTRAIDPLVRLLAATLDEAHHAEGDGFVAAQALTADEELAYREPLAGGPCEPAPEPAADVWPSPEMIRKVKAALDELRRRQKLAREAKRALDGQDVRPRWRWPREPRAQLEALQDPIAAAIDRAHAREAEEALRTPERLWTAAMRRAVERVTREVPK